jgi:hypothetical protein
MECLRAYAQLPHRLRLWIATPRGWSAVRQLDSAAVVTDDGARVPESQVTSWCAAYPNGQSVASGGPMTSLPHGVRGLVHTRLKEPRVVRERHLADGREWVGVTFGKCTLPDRGPRYFLTKLTNLSRQRIRVLDFGGYVRSRSLPAGCWATLSVFSAEEFRNWYASPEWIPPGASVWDPANWCEGPVLWCYRFEVDGGDVHVAGEVRESPGGVGPVP